MRPDGTMSRAMRLVADGARDLYPGYFALVMATGITSTVLDGLEHHRASAVLLVLTIVCGFVLVAMLLLRSIAYTSHLAADLVAPDRAFAFFTVVAACNVISARLAIDGHRGSAIALLVASGVAWVPLSYGIPARLILGPRHAPVLCGVNGTWFIWVVGTQSMAVAAAALEPGLTSDEGSTAALAATLMWSVGVVLYLVVAALVLIRLLLLEVDADDLNPPYWIAMGATAITVLAADHLLDVPATPVTTAIRPSMVGLAVVLWAFGTWLIPLLVVFSLWRHVLVGGRLSYGPPLWSVVFPLGMYSAASMALGAAAELPLISRIGRAEGWLAVAVWAAVFVSMLVHLARLVRDGVRAGAVREA